MVKKILALVICAAFLLAPVTYAGAASLKVEDAVFRLNSLGIMIGDENGNFNLDKEITRAEFAAVVVRMLGMESLSLSDASYGKFSDVSADSWAYSYISIASGLDIINGFEDGTFRPDETVTNEQALKMLVCALGYKTAAEKQGGYPDGYVTVAAGRGIMKNASAVLKAKSTRKDVAVYVNNALDVAMLETVSTDGDLVTGETLYDRLIQNMDGVWIRGKLTENEFTAIDGESGIDKGMVRIGGTLYNAGGTGVENYLGYMLEVYAKETDSSAIPVLLSFRIVKNKTEETIVDAADVTSFTPDEMEYSNEEKKKNKLDIDSGNADYIYNGKAVDPNTFNFDNMKINNGRYRLIDSEGTGKCDIIFVEEEESFVVERVAAANSTVYFANQELFKLRSGFKFRFDDDDYTYRIIDKNGKMKEFEDILPDTAITFIASEDMKVVTAILSDDIAEGKVQEHNSEDNEVLINDTLYKIAKNADGNLMADIKAGDEAVFVLDARDRIIGTESYVKRELYAYVVNADTKSSISSDLQLKVVSFGNKEKKVKTASDGAETVSYKFYNDNIRIIDCVDDDITKTDVIGKLIKYRLNSEGAIKKITDIYSVPGTKNEYTFNSRILAFGGGLDFDGFLVDDSTNVMCMPNVVRAEEDYLEVVNFNNGVKFEAVAYEVDPETQIAEAVLVFSDMNSTVPTPISSDTDISIVGKIRHMNDDEYGEVSEITGITGEKIFTELTGGNSAAEAVANNLTAGDLVRYTLDRNERLANIERIVSVKRLTVPYASTSSIFGTAYDIKFNRLSNIKHEIIDKIIISENEDGSGWTKEYEILKEDGPVIYVYEASGPRIYAATTDDIDTVLQAGGSASKIYMSIENSTDPEAIVIIKQ